MHLLLSAAAAGGQEIGLVGAFKENPWFLVLNVVVSVVVVTIVIERFVFQMGQYRVNSKEFFAQIKKLVVNGNIDRAIKLCDASDYPILQLVKSGLTHANKGPDEIDAALSEKLAELKPKVEARVAALWSLANIATLVGLVGTVFGLINSFRAISAENLPQAEKQLRLTAGIAEAMYNTFFGLLIAVICMVCHVVLHSKSKSIVHDLESTTERVFNLLTISAKAS